MEQEHNIISGYTAPEFDNILGEEESSLMQERDLVLRACATCQSQPGGGTTDLEVPGNAGLCTDPPDSDVGEDSIYWIIGFAVAVYGYQTSTANSYTYSSTGLTGTDYSYTYWTTSSGYKYYYCSGYTTVSNAPRPNGSATLSVTGTGHQTYTMYSAARNYASGFSSTVAKKNPTRFVTSTARHTVRMQQNQFKVFVGASTTANGKAYFNVSWASPVSKTAVTGDDGIASVYSSANTTGVTVTVSRYCSKTKTGKSKPNVQLGLAPTISSHEIATGGGIENHFTNAQTGGQDEVWTGGDLTAYGGSSTRCVRYHDIMHL